MPAPYSEDLRQKAIAAVERGERKTDVSRMLNISRNTLALWLKRREQTGNCQAITHNQQGNRDQITDWQRFRELAKQYGGKTQEQMALLWGDNVSQQNISDALRKLGWSRKKRHLDIKNRRSSIRLSENGWKGKRSLCSSTTGVAGIDNRNDYPSGYCEVGQRFYALKPGKRTETISWIAALRQEKVFAAMTIVGCCNRNLFEIWLEPCLLTQLPRGDVKGNW